MSKSSRFPLQKFLASLSVLVVFAGMFVGARVASADSVWVQSYERASQTQACVAQLGETPWQTNWGTDSSWQPSWEQWANSGTGGWTCTRSITWAQATDPASNSNSGGGSVTYRVGDTGPGGGLVFLIEGGLTYEMAPKVWSGVGTPDDVASWCSDTANSVTTSTALGAGGSNTNAMLTSAGAFVACTGSAPNEVQAFAGGGFSDWFLPSKDELNSMCNYSRNPTTPGTGACSGSQDVAFSITGYGFNSGGYWSSSQISTTNANAQGFSAGGSAYSQGKGARLYVRPIRAF